MVWVRLLSRQHHALHAVDSGLCLVYALEWADNPDKKVRNVVLADADKLQAH